MNQFEQFLKQHIDMYAAMLKVAPQYDPVNVRYRSFITQTYGEAALHALAEIDQTGTATRLDAEAATKVVGYQIYRGEETGKVQEQAKTEIADPVAKFQVYNPAAETQRDTSQAQEAKATDIQDMTPTGTQTQAEAGAVDDENKSLYLPWTIDVVKEKYGGMSSTEIKKIVDVDTLRAINKALGLNAKESASHLQLAAMLSNHLKNA